MLKIIDFDVRNLRSKRRAEGSVDDYGNQKRGLPLDYMEGVGL